jgi:catechol 2,3-dioxygenase
MDDDSRLPDATRLGRVRLQVADLGRSLDYYERVIGLRPLARTAERATLGAHDEEHELVELHVRPGAAAVPPHGRLGLYHFAILLPDRAALGGLLEHLATTGEHVGAADHLVSEAIYLHDPDGLGIEVYADRPREQWRRLNGELAMDTLPLDVESLVGAAAGHAWRGAPAGTRIGHIHLHVSDLHRADAFYHRALGLEPTVTSYRGALFLAAGGYHHHLGVNTWARGARSPADTDARLLDWELVLPRPADAAAAAARLRAAGHPVTEADGAWTVADADGSVLRIVAPVEA